MLFYMKQLNFFVYNEDGLFMALICELQNLHAIEKNILWRITKYEGIGVIKYSRYQDYQIQLNIAAQTGVAGG